MLIWTFMNQPGRNDPCHCGSGKKYKKCHLEADQRQRAVVRPAAAEPEPPPAFYDVKNLPKMLRQFSEHGTPAKRREFSDLLAKTGPILEYVAHQSEIEAAGAILETHRTEFEQLAADEERCLELARTLFSQECFARLRFSASEVQEAFEAVGYPAMMSPDDQTVETLRAAILHIADKDRRSQLSLRLLLELPQLVAAGRYIEAWFLQLAALRTAEDDEEANPFLFEMFSYGYDAWVGEKQARDASMLRAAGVDLDALKSMDMEGLESWLQAQASDPAKERAFAEFFQKNPSLREQSIANLEALERNCPNLLEREDARFLLLPLEETESWVKRFNDRVVEQRFAPETASQESALRLFDDVLLPVLREMADAIFTPERIRQLIADLKEYRAGPFAAGDKKAMGEIRGAIDYLEREDSPGQNRFLIILCWKSIGAAIQATPDEGPDIDSALSESSQIVG